MTMRFWVYDEDGVLLRKLHSREEAEKFLQDGWRIAVQPRQKPALPTIETHGEARW